MKQAIRSCIAKITPRKSPHLFPSNNKNPIRNYAHTNKTPYQQYKKLQNLFNQNAIKKIQIVYVFIFLATLGTPNAAHLKIHAKKDSNTTQSTSGFTKKQARTKQPKSSSEESSAERDRRLKRECRGRNNAGACLGYTR